jgi:PmbA protein
MIDSEAVATPSSLQQRAETDLALLDRLITMARREGADAADALIRRRHGLSVSRRLGRVENLERAESIDLGLRVFIGQRQAICATADISPDALARLVERAVAMAKLLPEDPYCGLARAEELATATAELDLLDPDIPDAAHLLERAAAAEDAALAVAGVTNSEGAEASWSITATAIVASNGFARADARSGSAISVSVVAGKGTAMERDYDYATAVHAGDLPDPAVLGRTAGEQAVKRLNPRKVPSAQVPVIFHPRTARSLLSHLASAINGAAVARGTTFLKDKMNSAICSDAVTIIDDPLRPRGLRSRLTDADGIATVRRAVVEGGVLRSWLLDLRSARQLGLPPTGHGVRSTSSPPSASPSNLYLAAGSVTPKDLMQDIKHGLYITDLMGFGVNGVTGDYSRGASGFFIENGALAFPVSELTISGNLLEMLRRLIPANDLEFRYGMDAPTLRLDGLTVAGQ